MKDKIEARVNVLQNQYQQLKSSLLRLEDDKRKLEPMVKELEIRLNEEQQLLAVLNEEAGPQEPEVQPPARPSQNARVN